MNKRHEKIQNMLATGVKIVRGRQVILSGTTKKLLNLELKAMNRKQGRYAYISARIEKDKVFGFTHYKSTGPALRELDEKGIFTGRYISKTTGQPTI